MQIDLDTQLGNLYQMYEELQAENALKLTQILDLEALVYDLRTMDLNDESPCWCGHPAFKDVIKKHTDICIKARQATEPFWKK
ncbi:hypothetical protein KW795_03010 [Candidatus Microgenomates bacterium]|nr:hypothetical protein [Candidatus Microgenomates bacterium]